jgi:hypothetical protein
MFKLKAPFLLVLIFIVMAGIIGPPCFANSAEPPSILIIVPNAPKDLEISLGEETKPLKAIILFHATT